MNENSDRPPQPEAVERGYEPDQVSRPFVLYSTLGLVLLMALGLLVAYTVSRFLVVDVAGTTERPELSRSAPPSVGPKVTADQPEQLRQLREWEASQLNDYGWVIESDVARIPIDRAMEIIAKNGLPKPQSGGETQPGTRKPPGTQEQPSNEGQNDNSN